MVAVLKYHRGVSITKYESYLNTVVAGCHSAILHLNIGWRMCEFAFGVRPRALVPLEFPTDFQLQPSGVLSIYQIIHINHSHYNMFCVAVL